MQDDTVFVLLDLSCDLEQLQNNGIGLCGDKFSVLECLGAQLLMQHVGGAMQYKPHAVGEECGAGYSVRSQIALHLLDEILGLHRGCSTAQRKRSAARKNSSRSPRSEDCRPAPSPPP